MYFAKVLVSICLLLPGALLAQENDARIVVTGRGVVEAVPDMATISLGVSAEAKEAAPALAEMAGVTRAVLARLATAGIADRDLQTSRLTLSPRYADSSRSDGSPPRIVGFVAFNMVTVRVRDLDALGPILDAVVQDGANELRGLQFGLQVPGPLMDEARVAAVKDAQARAALFAGAAGVTLGRVLSISEAGAAAPVLRMESAMMARDGAMPVATGEVEVSAQVNMVFEIGGV